MSNIFHFWQIPPKKKPIANDWDCGLPQVLDEMSLKVLVENERTVVKDPGVSRGIMLCNYWGKGGQMVSAQIPGQKKKEKEEEEVLQQVTQCCCHSHSSSK